MTNLSYILATRVSNLFDTQDRIADMIANQNTTAFKTEKNIFNELITKTSKSENLSFPIINNTKKDFSQGKLITTERSLDVAIEGKGFFKVLTPEGNFYTRNGSFQINEEGYLVTTEGYFISGEGGNNIIIPEDSSNISILKDGNVLSNGESIGNLALLTFEDVQLLEKHPNGLYSYKGQEITDNTSKLHRGMLETSNVNNIEEMTQLVDISNNISMMKKIQSQHHDQQIEMIKSLTNR